MRLGVAMLLSTIGGVGMWSVVVALPAIQAEFGVARADASLPYTLTMLGFAGGGVLMGRLADRFGIAVPLSSAHSCWASVISSPANAGSIWQVAVAHGPLIGAGRSATFGPLMAEISHWFVRRRGIAVAIAASGNYLAGTFWPPVVQHFIASDGWRATHIGIGIFLRGHDVAACSLALREPDGTAHDVAEAAARRQADCRCRRTRCRFYCASPAFACCMAMSMPQVHIVAYCGDLGYGVARGAEMLSLMLCSASSAGSPPA